MTSQAPGLAERRGSLEGARGALAGLTEVLHEASAAELADLLTLVDDVAAQASAARVTVTVEAVRRGECTGSGVHGWVRDHAPSLRQGGAGHVAALATQVCGTGAGLHPVEPDPGSPVGLLCAAVSSGSLAAPTATAVLREVERLAPLLRPEALPTVTAALVDLATEWGPSLMRRLRPRLLAEHGHHGALDDLHERLAAAARLSAPHVESGDLTEYQLWMTPEQAAALEAAIGPLSAPAPNAETGERDLRPAGQRRVEALTEVCRRSSAVDAEGAGDPSTAAAVVHVTMDVADLQRLTGAGEVLGSTADGTLLSPGALRRLACDAALVPYVLGTAGEVLEVGRVARLFTRVQRRLLRLRDRGCTYPGCTAPPDWARAHHLLHWADGGATDIHNAALLCQRHHTLVHRRRLWAELREPPDGPAPRVVWDLADGSYDRVLALALATPEPLVGTRAASHETPPGSVTPASVVPDPVDHPPPDDPDPGLDQWWADLGADASMEDLWSGTAA